MGPGNGDLHAHYHSQEKAIDERAPSLTQFGAFMSRCDALKQ